MHGGGCCRVQRGALPALAMAARPAMHAGGDGACMMHSTTKHTHPACTHIADGLAPPPHSPTPPPPAGGGSSSRAAAGRSGGGPSTSTSSSGGGGFAPVYLQQQGTAAPAAFQPPWAYAMGSYPAGPQPPPAAAAAASSEPPGKHARPYDMPSTAAFNNPWGGLRELSRRAAPCLNLPVLQQSVQ